jgi:hypothetical protein
LATLAPIGPLPTFNIELDAAPRSWKPAIEAICSGPALIRYRYVDKAAHWPCPGCDGVHHQWMLAAAKQ